MFIIFDEVTPSDPSSVETYWHYPPDVEKISIKDKKIDITLQTQNLIEKSNLSQFLVGIQDSEYLLSFCSSTSHSIDLCFGLSGSQPQGWVTPRFRTIDPSHCLTISGQNVSSMYTSTIVANKELGFEIISQTPFETFINCGGLGKVRIYITGNGPKFDNIN